MDSGRDAASFPIAVLALAPAALATNATAPFVIPNYIPVVLIEIARIAFLVSAYRITRSAHAPRLHTAALVVAALSLAAGLGAAESRYLFPFFYEMDALLGFFFLITLVQPIFTVIEAELAIGVTGLLVAAPATLSFIGVFSLLRGEPHWLLPLGLLIAVLFVLLTHFLMAFLRERTITRQRYHQVQQLNQQLNEAATELFRFRQRETLEELGGGIAHEINNPANYVSGNPLLLKERLPTAIPNGGELRELLDSAIQGGPRSSTSTIGFGISFGVSTARRNV